MNRICEICHNEGNYKCPTCLIYYCSAQCCKKHRENGCAVLVKHKEGNSSSDSQFEMKYASDDTVPMEKLELLRGSKNLKDLLCNPHLRDVLTKINNTYNPEKIMQMAMQEPLFVEFADECLKIVEPHND